MAEESIWIIGAGRFGRLAIKRLSDRNPFLSFVLVDPLAQNIDLPCQISCRTVCGDGIAFLNENLISGDEPSWIVPAIPRHLAAEWCMARLGPEKIQRIDLPRSATGMLPNLYSGDTGDIYVSYADFLCPDECPEPRQHCFVTGEQRSAPMFDRLLNLPLLDFTTLIIRSHQLAPGVGGYRPSGLFKLLEQVRGTDADIIISTACRCHGVLTALRKTG